MAMALFNRITVWITRRLESLSRILGVRSVLESKRVVDYRDRRNPKTETVSTMVDLALRPGFDPGHGGENLGAQANGINEKNWNLALGCMLAITIYDTADTPMLFRQDDYEMSFFRRGRASREQQCSVVICIHVNASSSPDAWGIQPYYLPGNERMEALANEIYRRAPTEIKNNKRLPFRASRAKGKWVENPIAVLSAHECDAVLVEVGFCTNPVEAAQLNNEFVRQKIVDAIVGGLAVIA